MITFNDLITDTKDELRINNVSSYFTDDLIKRTINKAYQWASMLFPFKELNFAKRTTTIANQQYYDYPSDFIPYSVWRITVDGKEYEELEVDEILKITNENQQLSNEYYYADYGKYFFLYPIPTVSDLEIVIWGRKVPDQLVNLNDKTIFSNSYPNGNEAITKKAVAMLIKRYEPKLSAEYNNDAITILTNYYNKQLSLKSHLRSKDRTFLKIPDFFS